MALDVIGLGLANSYTDEEVAGGGAIKGKNAVVDDISKSGKKNTVRFKWTLDNGTVLTGDMEVLDGENGAPGTNGKDGADGDPGPAGKGIASIAQVTGESKIIITYDDGTTSDPIDIPTVAGKDGKDGEDGIGVPVGGTAGQVLTKKTNDDYDTEWVNSGSDYHTYSTTEHVVGQWIDGSNIYEKVIESTTPNASGIIPNTLINGFSFLVQATEIITDGTGNIECLHGSYGDYLYFYYIPASGLYISYSGSDVSWAKNKPIKIILRYTKTHDYITDGLAIVDSRATIVNGGYAIENGNVYVDITVTINKNLSQAGYKLITGFPDSEEYVSTAPYAVSDIVDKLCIAKDSPTSATWLAVSEPTASGVTRHFVGQYTLKID